MSRLFSKRINKEINLYSKENFKFPNLYLRPNYENLHEWYFIVYDLKDTEYENGVYYGRIKLPNEYPLKPPSFEFITPNGRFSTNTKICTSFSNYHQELYTSIWNIMTMMEGLISFMTEDSTGIGYIKMSAFDRQNLAKESLEWNKKDNKFNKIFGDIDEILIK